MVNWFIRIHSVVANGYGIRIMGRSSFVIEVDTLNSVARGSIDIIVVLPIECLKA